MIKNLYLLFFFISITFINAWAQPEPTNHATGFSVTATGTSTITLSWTGATGATLPEFYFIVGRVVPSGTFATVADGAEVPADADWTNGNFAAIVAHAAGANSLPLTGLSAETSYEFAIYSYQRSGGAGGNSNYKIGGQPTETASTFSIEPDAHSTIFTATLNGNTTIDLVFDAASTLNNADGYLIYRNAGSAVNLSGLNDGAIPPEPLNGAIIVNTTNNSATTFSNIGLQGGITYHYALVPFNYNGSNAGTYNFKNDGSVPQASATTALVAAISEQSGGVSNALVGGNMNRAIIGFNFSSTGIQNITSAVFTLSNDASTLNLSGFELWESNVATYDGVDGTVVATGADVDVTGGVITITNFSATTSKYYFLICDVADLASANTFNVEFTSASSATGTISTTAPYFSRSNISISALTASIVQQSSGVSNTLVGGDTNEAIIGFSLNSNGSQSLTQTVFTLSNDASTLNLTGFELWESNIATYDGVDGTVVATGADVDVTGGVITITNFSATTSKYYFLICDVTGGAPANTFNVEFTSAIVNPVGSSISTSAPYFSHTNISIETLTTTLSQLSLGVAASPLIAGTSGSATQNAILGFSLQSNGAQTATAITFGFDTDPTNKFTSYGLVTSPDNSFATTGGGQALLSLSTSTPTVSGTGPYYITLTPTSPIDLSTIKYLFLVVTVNQGINTTTIPTTLTPSISAADLTLNPIGFTANSFNGTVYNFSASRNSTIAIHSTSGVTSPIDFPVYSANTATSGLTWGGSPNSTSLANFRIRDGGGASDSDNQSTKLTDFTLTITNPADLETIAIFYGNSINNSNIKVGEQSVGAGTISFSLSGGTLTQALTAADNGDAYFTVRTTFKSAVTDKNTHVVTVTAATVDPDGSALSASPLTSATTGAGASINNINVVATKVVFTDAMPIVTDPSPATFSATIIATDANGNFDPDQTSNVTISATGGPGSISASEGLTKALVGGTYQWTTLTINLAGDYTLTGNHASFSNANDATGSVDVQSLGVSITDGLTSDPPTLALCYGGDFQNLGDIKIEESDPSDFSTGTGVTFSLQLPYGYVFDPTITTAPTLAGSEISSASVLSYAYGNSVVQFSYTVTGIANINSITITGLKVKYTLNSAPTETLILRRGGTAVQAGNDVGTELSHGSLTSSEASNVGYDFIVKQFPGEQLVQPTETNFSASVTGVFLEPSNGANSTTNDIFSGNGVSFSSNSNRYVFSPSSVGPGSNYLVAYKAQDINGCQITVTKTFTVFISSIDGLQASYCANDGPTSLSVTPDKYDISQYYTPWNSTTTYYLNYTVSYGGKAYKSLSGDGTNINVPPTSDPTKWKEIKYVLESTLPYSVYVPSYKKIEAITNNGSGTITFTITNHGFTNGTILPLYCTVYDADFNVLVNIPYNQSNYVVSNATTNTFTISYLHPTNPGTYTTNVYGNAYLTGPSVTNVTGIGTNTLTVTANGHGLSNGTTVLVYLNGINNTLGVTNRIYDWFTISGVTTNTFNITSTTVFSGVWSGNGFVDIFNYRVSTFTPADIPTFNTRFNGISQVYVGFLVKYNDCVQSGSNTCNAFVWRNDPVRIYQLPILNFTGLNPTFCPNDAPVNLTGNQTDGQFSSSGGGAPNAGITDGGAGFNTATFDPGDPNINPDTDFLVIYNYLDQNGCTSTTNQTVKVFSTLPAPTGNDIEYCQGDQPPILVTVTGAGTNFIWYSDNLLTNQVGIGSFYDTQLDPTIPITKEYFVVQTSGGGCYSPADPVNVTIKPAPAATFTLPPPCEDRDFTLTGPNGMIAWDWDFGDGNTATGQSVIYQYTTQGTRTITLTVTDPQNCKGSQGQQLPVGPNPKPSFTFDQTCDGDLTQFHATSDIGTSYSWEFGDGSNSLRDPAVDRSHTYSNVGIYTVTLKAFTDTDCYDSLLRDVPILEYIQGIDIQNPYVMANLNGGDGFWLVEDARDSTTWQFEIANKDTIKSTSKVWITNAVNTYKANDRSFVNSPCLNLTNLSRPVFSMEYIMNTNFKNLDGATLEYSIDGGVIWNPVGDHTTGLSWFNTQGFSSNVGNNSLVGWSGDLWEVRAGQIYWLEGKHKLDNIIPRSKVRFRVAFGTNGDSQYEGFAFTNLKIENRNRQILIENFTNEFDNQYAASKTVYDNITLNESVKLQYHVRYPKDDSNTKINSADQSARAAYYGVTLIDETIPRAYVDGVSGGNITQPWVATRRDRRDLTSAPVLLTVDSEASNEPGYLKASVTITALRNLPDTLKPKLIIAAVEILDASSNQYVVRKIFPSPVGIKMPLPMMQGNSVIIKDSTLMEEGVFNAGNMDIALVAFIQDEITKEVYQSAINTSPTFLPTLITDAEDPEYSTKINLYPNPANHEVNVVLPAAVNKATPLTLVDEFGRVVYQNYIEAGKQTKVIRTTDYAGGVYILQIGTPNGGIARKKVMVVHN